MSISTDSGPDSIGGEGLAVGRVVELAAVDVDVDVVEAAGAVVADRAVDEGVVAAVGLVADGDVDDPGPGGSDDEGAPGIVAVFDSASEEALAGPAVSVSTPRTPIRPITIRARYGRRGSCVAADIDLLLLMGTGGYDTVSS